MNSAVIAGQDKAYSQNKKYSALMSVEKTHYVITTNQKLPKLVGLYYIGVGKFYLTPNTLLFPIDLYELYFFTKQLQGLHL